MLTTGIELVQKLKIREAITLLLLLFFVTCEVFALLYIQITTIKIVFLHFVFTKSVTFMASSGLRFVLIHSSEWLSKLYLQITFLLFQLMHFTFRFLVLHILLNQNAALVINSFSLVFL
jgi:hypothetical protein